MDAIVWHDKPRNGGMNMAIDEAMAQFAASSGCVILRIYYWEQPFLSLGYFQSAKDRLSYPLIAGLPYTRRLSGGGAIVHDREITYSLAIADPSGSKSPANVIYSQVHAAVSESLRAIGFESHTAAELGGTTGLRLDDVEPFLCFQRRADADLIVDGHKIVGSAQRRIAGVLLQHGSILLSASKHAPDLLGVADLGRKGSYRDWDPKEFDRLAEDLIGRFQSYLSRSIAISSWSCVNSLEDNRLSTIGENMRRIAIEKYNSVSWTDKR